MNRPNSYKKVERKKQKKIKKRYWSKKGDYFAPIMSQLNVERSG